MCVRKMVRKCHNVIVFEFSDIDEFPKDLLRSAVYALYLARFFEGCVVDGLLEVGVPLTEIDRVVTKARRIFRRVVPRDAKVDVQSVDGRKYVVRIYLAKPICSRSIADGVLEIGSIGHMLRVRQRFDSDRKWFEHLLNLEFNRLITELLVQRLKELAKQMGLGEDEIENIVYSAEQEMEKALSASKIRFWERS